MSMMIAPYRFAATGGSYVEVGTLGKQTTGGTSAANSGANLKYASPTIVVPAGGVWVKQAYFGFRTASVGNKFIPVLYAGSGNATDTLVKQGQEYTFASAFANVGTDIGPINWNADGSAIFLAEGTYMMGLMTPTTGMALEAGVSGSFKRTSDTYSDGAAATFGTITSFGVPLRAWMQYSLGGP